jgi:hypothetical protein
MTSKRVQFPPAECDLDTHSVISTRRVYFLTLSVISTRTRLISTHTRESLTRMRVNMTLTGVFSTRSSVISTRRVLFLHAVISIRRRLIYTRRVTRRVWLPHTR